MVDVARRTEELIRDLVESEGFELVHVEYAGRGSAPILRIYVDRPGGISVDDCAEISRQVSVLLDVEDFVPNQYTLEVSSPGIERPLFKAEDFERFTGKEVSLTTVESIGNRRNFKGLILKLSDGVLELDCDGSVCSIPLAKVKKANLVYQFE